jgi:hypothetical protein
MKDSFVDRESEFKFRIGDDSINKYKCSKNLCITILQFSEVSSGRKIFFPEHISCATPMELQHTCSFIECLLVVFVESFFVGRQETVLDLLRGL